MLQQGHAWIPLPEALPQVEQVAAQEEWREEALQEEGVWEDDMKLEAQLVSLLEWLEFGSVQWQLDPFGDKNVFAIKPGEGTPQRIELTLDLIAEAESKLTPTQRDDYYYTHLHKKDEDHSWTVSASKEERLLALVKVIGKFTETRPAPV